MASGDCRQARIDAVFAAALELPQASRPAFLEQRAGGDATVKADVEELLRLAARPDPSLASGGLAASPLWRDGVAASAEGAGTRLGAWRLASEIGHGGMGTVWLAERADGQFAQRAALKCLHAGPQAQAFVARFQQERQILARLDHPNIARLLDGGLTDDGRPWFTMEHVEGVPIDAFCDAHALSIAARLRLFADVGRAVQAAHGSLVAHRDLKPSNILVTRDGHVRLVDFGIATPLDGPLDPERLTRTLLVLTPEYASPEQVRGEPATAASDIYQLGLLLYELLVGDRPQRMERVDLSELEHVVCHRAPPPPSAVARRVAHEAAARNRRTTPRGLSRALSGDLDAIVSKALRKAPDRRYGSAAELVDDVERHLRGLPVRARPETASYRLRTFVRRHRLGVAAGVVVAALVVAYASTVTWQARQLARQRDQVAIEAAKAARVRDFLIGLFAAADPYRQKGASVTAEDLVTAGAVQIRHDLHAAPEVRGELLGVLGDVLMGLGAHDRAESLVTEALALQRRLHPGDHPDLARAVARAGTLAGGTEDAQGEEVLARQALAMRRRLFGEAHQSVADSLGQVATALTFQARYPEAEATYRQALALRGRLGLARDASAATLWNDLGVVLEYTARRVEAVAAHQVALGIRRQILPPDHADVSESLNNLALALSNQSRLAEAEPLYRDALAIQRRAFGTGNIRVAVALHNLGVLLRRAGRLDEAEATHREALAIRRRFMGGANSNVALSLGALGDVARDRGSPRDAERRYHEALAMFRATLPQGHPRVAWAAVGLGRIRLRQPGRLQDADALLQEGVTGLHAALGERNELTSQARLALGLCRRSQGRPAEARALLEAGLAPLDGVSTADRRLVDDARQALAALR